MNIESEPAYLVHSRKYTDSRILVDFITQSHGRISGVFRQSKKSSIANSIQSFTPLLINWKGKSSLKTITQVESSATPIMLTAENLYCGFYLNELILRALAQDDPCDAVYHLYLHTLNNIGRIDPKKEMKLMEESLRRFELSLLGELGFGVNFYEDALQNEIDAGSGKWYQFIDDQGFVEQSERGINRERCYPANYLVAIRELRFDDPQTLKYAKNICRIALKSLIGDKPLKAREFFR